MNKLWLIIKREYLSRVTTRSFILTTLLTPLAIGLFMVVINVIFSYQGGDKKVLIKDEANLLEKAIKDEQNLHFTFSDENVDVLRKNLVAKGFDGLLVIPKIEDPTQKNIQVLYYADDQMGLDLSSDISRKLEERIREYKIQKLSLDKDMLASLESNVTLEPEPLDPSKKEEDTNNPSSITSALGAALGFIMGMFMYFVVFIYGMMIMRSVMEEKTSRIVEVMISSVKPFQLMLGKIIGVGAVGLTQVGIWAILIPIISIATSTIFGIDTSAQTVDLANNGVQFDSLEVQEQVALLMNEIGNLDWWVIIPLFIFYFLGGYILYASLFAAVGSAMGDDIGEGQSLTIPITIPVVMAFYIMTVVIRQPESNLATWASIFPLFSPIVMPARLAFHPPAWEIALSIVMLILTVVLFVWLSGRIYRVGILMYGKKVTLKELGKWLFYKD